MAHACSAHSDRTRLRLLRHLLRSPSPGACALACLALFASAPSAAAQPYLPPPGKVWHGVASGASTTDFAARTGRAPAVWQHWLAWNGGFAFAFERAERAGTRMMIHLSTARGQNRRERISPGAIARGAGDRYLLGLSRRMARHGAPVYLRLMAEMNNCDLAYSSHDCSGRRRNRDHSPGRFKQAWRRVVVVLRGGPVDGVNAKLRALGMRGVMTDRLKLPEPQVAFLWSPMTGGSPMIAALRPGVFWPGSRYVDWVSTSFYSRFPNFQYLEPYYRRFANGYRKPFAFGEWAMWGADNPSFPRRLFAWARSHGRVRMMIYNQGEPRPGLFRLRRYPRSQRVIRAALNAPRFAVAPAELR